MKKKFFGTDGIRGKYGEFPIINSFFLNLATSIKNSHSNVKNIIIGKDTRESCNEIESALITGFCREKIKCDLTGIVSTPILSFITKSLNYDLGIMISASHNPFYDNGIKIFKKNGEKLTDEEEINIENNLNIKDEKSIGSDHTNHSSISIENYENYLIKKFSNLSSYENKILIDCANGSLSRIAPKIFNNLGLNFVKYACEPNGKNINTNCGATYPEKLSSRTLSTDSHIGISFDGDADRVLFCDETGNIIDGDFILAILSNNLMTNNFLENNLVVTTKMSNLGFRHYLDKQKINYILSDVGDRYVIEMMKSHGACIGGEQSGHIIFSENSYCGDGLLTALQILEILNKKKCSLFELSNDLFQKFPQKLINLKVMKEPNEILEDLKIKRYLSNVLEKKDCDILLRKSGTENLLRLMVQSNSKELTDFIIRDLVKIIKEIDEN